jgi:hypothetical protein
MIIINQDLEILLRRFILQNCFRFVFSLKLWRLDKWSNEVLVVDLINISVIDQCNA